MHAFKKYRNFLSHFGSSSRGNVAVLSALIVLPVMMLSGGLIDYAKAGKAKAQVSAALDTAILAAMQQYSLDNTIDYEQVINDYINKNLVEANKAIHAENVVVSGVDIVDGEMTARVTAKVTNNFLPLLGINSFDISSQSAAKVGGSSVEIALVLDNTGSMEGSKIEALKESATDLVNAIMLEPDDEKIKFSLVPFADYVNIGTDNRNEAGLDVPADYDYTPEGENCWNEYPNSTRSCTPVVEMGTCYNDSGPYSCEKTVDWDCTGDLGEADRHCLPYEARRYEFFGCMGSRLNGDDKIELSPVDGVPGLMERWDNCGHVEPMTRLTSKRVDIISGLNQMKSKGYTHIPAGLAWGWRSISSTVPFTDASEDGTDKVKKVIVLMTDGANTRSQGVLNNASTQNHTGTVYNHNSYSQSDADLKTKQLCEDIANNTDIMVYTIAFDVAEGSSTQTLMKDCAVNGGQYYDADDDTQLADAFKKIGLALMNLRLSQ